MRKFIYLHHLQKWLNFQLKCLLSGDFEDQNATSQAWMGHFVHQNKDLTKKQDQFGRLHFLSPLAPSLGDQAMPNKSC